MELLIKQLKLINETNLQQFKAFILIQYKETSTYRESNIEANELLQFFLIFSLNYWPLVDLKRSTVICNFQ